MKFTAHLVTSRELPRHYQDFAPDLVNAEGIAREYLKGNGCVDGDKFEIYEIKPSLVKTIERKDPNKIAPGE